MSSTAPTCKVCRDAGKTHEEYSSHRVKDKKGNVTCPILLANTCHCCQQKGHTVKYCPDSKKSSVAEKTAPVEINTASFANIIIHRKSDKQSYASILMMNPAKHVVAQPLQVVQVTPIVATADAFNAFIKKNTIRKSRKHSWASETSESDYEEEEMEFESDVLSVSHIQQDHQKTNALKEALHIQPSCLQ
jgi:hypothetical protein